MDKDRVKGVSKAVSGSIKEAVGKITGDRKIQAEGMAEKLAGKTQNKVGSAKDNVRDKFEE